MRVALIGPVPPRLGGLTPGGVATHQMYLAEGLAAAGVDVALLATNTSVDPACWGADGTETPEDAGRQGQVVNGFGEGQGLLQQRPSL